ncbi:MAG: ATP synthase F0 subunit C [Deltaproteobacteria bacterium]|nr:ATP synthase F0 subunit C [Deltaproteobacteria bacterium]
MIRKWFLRLAALGTLASSLAPGMALAVEGEEPATDAAMASAATAETSSSVSSLGIALAGGIGIGIAAFGGALGQGRTMAAALEGIARNPEASGKIQTPMIIGLALIESLVIYALLIALMLVGKI